jgi:crotonobetainyl-CoA:carnitine CoA-transferase CaiB-like acyl-CoA transferase
MLLADLGADVIKVEDPAHGDDTRQWGPPWAGERDNAASAYFLSVNRNKRSLTLNLKSDEGQEIARRLAARSQIVVENFKPGQMTRFGLDYAALSSLNPALVYCSITGFGQTGPYASRPGYDFVIQGMSGLMSVTGPVEGPPSKVGVALADVIAGQYALSSILAALRHAEQSGQGQQIDVALFDTQLAALVNVASNYLVSGQTPARYGNEHANIVPYQSFSAADGEFTVAVGNDRQFAALCRLLERPEWATDPRFATNPQRVQNRQTLIPLLQAAFLTQPVETWVEALLALGIPCGPINTVAAALEDPHVQARGLVQNVTLPDGTQTRLVGPAIPFSATPAEVRLPPPSLGQHTDAILRGELGMNAITISTYRSAGII